MYLTTNAIIVLEIPQEANTHTCVRTRALSPVPNTLSGMHKQQYINKQLLCLQMIAAITNPYTCTCTYIIQYVDI